MGTPAGRVWTERITTPDLSTRSKPAPWTVTARAGVRSCTVMTTRFGQDLLTVADWIWLMLSTRWAAPWVLTRIILALGVMPAAARTWPAGTRWLPVTTTDRTSSQLEPKTTQPRPISSTTAASPAKNADRQGLRVRASDGCGDRFAPSGRAPGPGPAGADGRDDSATDAGAAPGSPPAPAPAGGAGRAASAPDAGAEPGSPPGRGGLLTRWSPPWLVRAAGRREP